VPDWVKPSFVIFDIRALCRYPYGIGNSGPQRAKCKKLSFCW